MIRNPHKKIVRDLEEKGHFEMSDKNKIRLYTEWEKHKPGSSHGRLKKLLALRNKMK